MNPSNDKKTVLALFAHPDDESFGSGGTLALYASQGHDAYLVTATRGEVGEISSEQLANQETLGEVREQELRKAAEILGINPPIILGYRDSGMAGTSDNENPEAFANADASEVVARLVGIIRELKPDVILTFDENGGYGHPDHIAIHTHASVAFDAASDPGQFVDQGPAWESSALYYVVFPKSTFGTMKAALRENGVDTSDLERFEESGAGWPDDQIDVITDVSSVVDAKWDSLNAHRTQFGDDNLFKQVPLSVAKGLMSQEHFVQAKPESRTEGTREGLF